jgi:hypothetical protein
MEKPIGMHGKHMVVNHNTESAAVLAILAMFIVHMHGEMTSNQHAISFSEYLRLVLGN